MTEQPKRNLWDEARAVHAASFRRWLDRNGPYPQPTIALHARLVADDQFEHMSRRQHDAMIAQEQEGAHAAD